MTQPGTHADDRHANGISKGAILSSPVVRYLPKRHSIMDLHSTAQVKMMQKGKTLRTRVNHSAPFTDKCDAAQSTVDFLDNGIDKDVVPKLEQITFSHTLDKAATETREAKTAAAQAKQTADRESTDLDICRGQESQSQSMVSTLEGQVDKLRTDKNEECNRTQQLKTYTFSMPERTRSKKFCNIPDQDVDDCWDHAYLKALEDLEIEVEGERQTYLTSKGACAGYKRDLLTKSGQLDQQEDILQRKRRACNDIEEDKEVAYCAFNGKVEDLCEKVGGLQTVWTTLENQRQMKRDSIRTMKITKCIIDEHYTLGNTGCTGCRLGSAVDALGACEAKFPETEDYGVEIVEPPILTESKSSFFGLAPSTEAGIAWCGGEGSADVSFPGLLWTRDDQGVLSRAEAPEATTITAIAEGC